ncbi:hypothetical protein PAXRUDRAFT_22615 [Paxillus rubicundulus Ve08.2h10]|uniref:Uncharacterized protein n=1 Tax=Paxillus rubicundulus Ve08.2h10 TaxID=930991 RepID=A0A0D0CX94_9AGAM|nr:hypothetical protein PAXRUDRAFT_22615 [Paxillus rubicundulus Ve08.2h10]
MTTALPTLIPRPGEQAAERRRLKERMDDIKSEDEDPIGDATPAPPSPPPHTPIPVPNPTQ